LETSKVSAPANLGIETFEVLETLKVSAPASLGIETFEVLETSRSLRRWMTLSSSVPTPS
jgi:hypothetical protein